MLFFKMAFFNDFAKKARSVQVQGIMNIRKKDSINSVNSSLKSHSLWVTLYGACITLVKL